MKRRILYVAMAAVLLCSCASEEKKETTSKEENVAASEEVVNEELKEEVTTEIIEGISLEPGEWKKQVVFLQCCSKEWELETEIRDGHDYYEAECHDHGYAIARKRSSVSAIADSED